MKDKGPRFLPGEKVTIVSRDEMLATLDAQGTIGGMPLMPQMLEMAGSEQQIYKRADKSCDTVDGNGGRKLENTVHLLGTRCNGLVYGGCEARCLLFWHESWLRRTKSQQPVLLQDLDLEAAFDLVNRGTVVNQSDSQEPVYRCQATEVLNYSKPLSGNNMAQYWNDWRYNDVKLRSLVRAGCFSLFQKSLKLGAYRFQLYLFNHWQKIWGRPPFPNRSGNLDKTPNVTIDLQPGESVRVKSYDEIIKTLDKSNKNRGLYFDAEMVRYCGQEFRVQQRLSKIINEKSGVMIKFGDPSIVLANVYCRSKVSAGRLFCPRSIHHYWREIWLERTENSTEFP